MKRIIIGILAVCFSAYASVCLGAYIIHLKDGREIVTDQYLDEGDRIKLHRYGGTIGIQKDQILKIEEIDKLPNKRKKIVVKPKPDKEEKAAPEKANMTPPDKGKKHENKKDTEASKQGGKSEKQEKNALLKEFDALKERFQYLESMSKKEILQFDKDLTQLRNKIIKAGLAGPYADELSEILTMGSKAEEVLKNKGSKGRTSDYKFPIS